MSNTTAIQPMTAINNTVYLPWSWTIVSTDPAKHPCPSVSGVLTTFATVNIVASLLSIVFGNRDIVNIFTKGKLGKPKSNSWWWTWTITVGLNLVANAIIAGIIKNSVGYKADFKLWELMLFLLARPRLTWIVMAFFSDKYGKTVSVPLTPVDQQNLLPQQSGGVGIFSQGQKYEAITTVSTRELRQSKSNTTLGINTHELRPSKSTSTLGSDAVYAHEFHDDPVNGPVQTYVERKYDLPYLNTFLSSIIAEVLMQLAALYVMGITVRFAWRNGYYNVGFNHKLYKQVFLKPSPSIFKPNQFLDLFPMELI
jgi:hypothetical protein